MRFFAVAVSLLLVAALRAQEPSSIERPAWAQSATPETLSGTIWAEGEHHYLKLGTGRQYLLDESRFPVENLAGLTVEAKGWVGEPPASPATLLLVKPPTVSIPALWSLPFILLLLCIACFPFVHKHFWEHHYHHVAVGLGAVMVAVYLGFLGHYGRERMIETALEYFKFIALIGSLYVVTGGILVEVSGSGSPRVNTILLGVGALLANLLGTTGAAALLIRPYLRLNKDRLQPFHVVMFIFIVANCGGALTPIGDPPLFLGYLYGVPFQWTILHCWPAWLFVITVLLTVFYWMDRAVPRQTGYGLETSPSAALEEPTRVRISGWTNVFWLGVVLLGVFLDRLLEPLSPALKHWPIGACAMLLAAAAAYKTSKPGNLARNEFNFGPIREVAYLFVGIFATMVPALDYLAANAGKLGVTTPSGFYFASGALSSFLDNAPTYLNFLTAAHGLKELALAPENMPLFIARHAAYLLAISLGSVFFGACTYIGNGPNFMVKAIADASGAQTPGFFGYIVKYTLPILLPLYALVWLFFFVK